MDADAVLKWLEKFCGVTIQYFNLDNDLSRRMMQTVATRNVLKVDFWKGHSKYFFKKSMNCDMVE